MPITRYSATHKQWDHVGNLTPLVEHSESVRPHFPSEVAYWLPASAGANNTAMGFMSRFDVRDEDYVVLSSGKCVAIDRTGGLLPAGVRQNWLAAAGGTIVLEYDATDVAQRVTNLATGSRVTAAVTYTKTALQTQLRELGLLTPTETLEQFVSRPIGLASYNYMLKAGSDLDNPSTFRFHNYKMQDRVAVLCDYVVRLPHVPSAAASSTVPAFADSFALANLDDENATAVWGSLATFQTQMDRYDDVTNTDVVGLALRFAPSATATDRTPLTWTRGATDVTDTVLLRARSSVDALSADGDYFWDPSVGVLWFYEAGGNALPALVVAADLAGFQHYRAVPASVSTYASVVGPVQPGDFLGSDGFSNLVRMADFVAGDVVTVGAPTDAELAVIMNQVKNRAEETLGQVLGFVVHPRDALDRVRTAWRTLGTQDQMPGSASKGFPDTVTYTSAADREVIINLLGR